MIPSSRAAPPPDNVPCWLGLGTPGAAPMRAGRGKTMLSRLVLLAAQLVAGWVATPSLLAMLPPVAGLHLFAYGLVAAVVVCVVGLVLSHILRDTRPPSGGTLAVSIVLALAGAALVYW